MSEESNAVVYIVEDDDSIRGVLSDLLHSVGLTARAFASADQFLEVFEPHGRACLVLDIRLNGMSGLALQEHLVQRNIPMPVIFISGYADVSTAVQAMKAGASDFLEKPLRAQVFLDAVQKCLEHDALRFKEQARSDEIQGLMARLTPREREVLEMIMDGLSNKEMARKIDVSPKTIEAHRANLYTKMRADSLAELVRKAASIQSK